MFIQWLFGFIRGILTRNFQNANWQNPTSVNDRVSENPTPRQVIPTQSKIDWSCPVSNPVITLPYGKQKIDGNPNYQHSGIDYSGRLNKNCLMVVKGEVRKILLPDRAFPCWFKYNSTIGKYEPANVPQGRAWTPYIWVYPMHTDEIMFVYKHVDAGKLEVGTILNAGDVLAEIGNLGYSQGPHLHFEVWVKKFGKWATINPELFLSEKIKGV